jgi:hypothetical protein
MCSGDYLQYPIRSSRDTFSICLKNDGAAVLNIPSRDNSFYIFPKVVDQSEVIANLVYEPSLLGCLSFGIIILFNWPQARRARKSERERRRVGALCIVGRLPL